MKAKRITTAILAMLMLVSTVSCARDDGNENVTMNPAVTTNAPTESTVPEETQEYIKPDVTYKDETVTIASYDYRGDWDILKYTFTLDEIKGDVINDAIVKRNAKVEEDFGVDLQLFSLNQSDRADSSKLQKEILSGDDHIQIALAMNGGLAPMLASNSMLVDLKEISTLDLSKSWWNQQANDEYTLYNKQMMAVGDICFFNNGAPIVTYFSKDMVTDLGLENPYQLVYDGKWTQDKLMEMSRAAARDLNGNSKVDDADAFGFAGQPQQLEYILLSANVRISEHTADGEIKLTLNSEKTIGIVEEITNFLLDRNVCRIQGKTEKEYANAFSEYFVPKLVAKELLFFSNQLLVALNLRAAENDFGILPMPKYDEAQLEYVSTASNRWSDHVVVPISNTKLDMTGHILDALGYYSQQYVTPAFIDTSVKTKAVRDEDSVKMIELVLDTQVFDVAMIYNWGLIESTIPNFVFREDNAFSTQYAKIEKKVLAELEATNEALRGY